MSTKLRRWGPLLTSIAFLLMISTGAGAAITPESDVLLPWFEVDLANPDAGVATTFSIVNASAGSVRTRLTMYTNWGIPVLEVPLTFSRAEAKTLDLRAWIARGVLPEPGVARAGAARSNRSAAPAWRVDSDDGRRSRYASACANHERIMMLAPRSTRNTAKSGRSSHRSRPREASAVSRRTGRSEPFHGCRSAPSSW